MPISHKHRAIFVHIPKTGGTSIEVALEMFGDWRTENQDSLFGQVLSPQLLAKNWTTRFLQHLTWQEIVQISSPSVLEGYLSFACVRNPWDRMVSVFSNKDPDLVMSAQRSGLAVKDLSFDDFVGAICDYPHVHLRPQLEFVVDSTGRIAVDELLRFEKLIDDYQRLRDLLGLDSPLPHRNASRHRPYQDFYSPASRVLVARRYAADIDAFGYRF